MIAAAVGQAPGDPAFEQLLLFIRDQRGFDFTGYKRQSLRRRTDKRMAEVGIDDYEAYRQHLEVNPEEFPRLFDTILINVTGFFRDPPAWEQLQHHVLPAQLAHAQPDEPLRVWTPGCASGEEAYTVAMVLAELLGIDRVRDRVKIYATDVDEDALETARRAVYDAEAVRAVPAALQSRYLVPHDRGAAVHPDLRRAVIFGRHDLVADAPIGRIDLLTCRNTLMYFNAEAQARIVGRLHFSLRDTGTLMLGRVESLLAHAAMFEPVDRTHRLFRKVTGPGLRGQLQELSEADRVDSRAGRERQDQLQAMVDAGPAAQLLVDGSGALAAANRQARTMFGLTAADLGRPFQDLEVSYRPAELRSWITRAVDEGRTLRLDAVTWPRADQEGAASEAHLAIEVTPVPHGTAPPWVVLTVHDRSDVWRLQQELQLANAELESAYEQLQSTNEELETTNEELQSTNEELETTNEELQSTNEELETMNVELQATNEELQAANDELRRRSGDLDQVNAFLESILANLDGGVAVVDRDLVVSVWNEGLTDLWGLRGDEAVGLALPELDIGLPVDQLTTPLGEVLSGRQQRARVTLAARNRLGREVTVQVTCAPLLDRTRGMHGAIVRMVDIGVGDR